MTEDELLAKVTARCRQLGIWWVHIDTPYHNKRRQNMTGFPDLFLCGPGGIAFRELKTELGRLDNDQADWKDRLRSAAADWGIWRPSDLRDGIIESQLQSLL